MQHWLAECVYAIFGRSMIQVATMFLQCVFILLFLPGLLTAQHQVSQPPTIALPEELRTVQGKRGTVFVMMSPTCPICQKITLGLKDLITSYRKDEIAFVLVFPDSTVDWKSIDSFKQKYGLQNIVALRDSLQTLTSKLNATVTPEFVLVGAHMQILYQGRMNNLFERIGVM
ncbi:MAG: redoxin domain-containing protein, partial [Candidatus Kapabacteria bacterium]|nr:redoxin domain-containing protein [Candidatus Kapabacteria bacterium]